MFSSRAVLKVEKPCSTASSKMVWNSLDFSFPKAARHTSCPRTWYPCKTSSPPSSSITVSFAKAAGWCSARWCHRSFARCASCSSKDSIAFCKDSLSLSAFGSSILTLHSNNSRKPHRAIEAEGKVMAFWQLSSIQSRGSRRTASMSSKLTHSPCNQALHVSATLVSAKCFVSISSPKFGETAKALNTGRWVVSAAQSSSELILLRFLSVLSDGSTACNTFVGGNPGGGGGVVNALAVAVHDSKHARVLPGTMSYGQSRIRDLSHNVWWPIFTTTMFHNIFLWFIYSQASSHRNGAPMPKHPSQDVPTNPPKDPFRLPANIRRIPSNQL